MTTLFLYLPRKERYNHHSFYKEEMKEGEKVDKKYVEKEQTFKKKRRKKAPGTFSSSNTFCFRKKGMKKY